MLLIVSTACAGSTSASHGRALGDDSLIRTANLLQGIVRPVDMVARVGGDEFAVWLDNMDHMTAAERAVGLADRRLVLPEQVGDADQAESEAERSRR